MRHPLAPSGLSARFLDHALRAESVGLCTEQGPRGMTATPTDEARIEGGAPPLLYRSFGFQPLRLPLCFGVRLMKQRRTTPDVQASRMPQYACGISTPSFSTI